MSYRKVHFFIFSIILFVSFFALTSFASAARPITELKGWAWSSNIGWISMSCENQNTCATRDYRVSVNQDTGALTGYAWSDNVGWLQFGGLSGFPIGTNTVAANATLSEQNTLTGWARFCAGTTAGVCNNTMTSRTDGWDGWVSLSGRTVPDVAGNVYNYGITLQSNNQNFEGFAWGSDVVGWVDFSQVVSNSANVSVSLNANPTIVKTSGANTILTWISKNATSCTPTADSLKPSWTGTSITPNVAGTKPISITQDITFTLNCVGSNGSSATSSVFVDLDTGGGGGGGNNCPNGKYADGTCVDIDPVNPGTSVSCTFSNGELFVEGKIYYQASLVPSGDVCKGSILSCDADGVISPAGYESPTCRVSPVIRPI
jgi:hypothetical protein